MKGKLLYIKCSRPLWRGKPVGDWRPCCLQTPRIDNDHTLLPPVLQLRNQETAIFRVPVAAIHRAPVNLERPASKELPTDQRRPGRSRAPRPARKAQQ